MTPIDKNIPIPPSNRKTRNRYRKYQWEAMEVGDSFLFARTEKTKQASINSMCCKHSKKLNRTFEWHLTDEGYRCWRVK